MLGTPIGIADINTALAQAYEYMSTEQAQKKVQEGWVKSQLLGLFAGDNFVPIKSPTHATDVSCTQVPGVVPSRPLGTESVSDMEVTRVEVGSSAHEEAVVLSATVDGDTQTAVIR
jgi:hypothetical protein